RRAAESSAAAGTTAELSVLDVAETRIRRQFAHLDHVAFGVAAVAHAHALDAPLLGWRIPLAARGLRGIPCLRQAGHGEAQLERGVLAALRRRRDDDARGDGGG